MADNRKIEPMDKLVGSRIRLRRRVIGVSQQALADHLGISFQQVQKYEVGANRVGASRLQAIAEKLEVSPGYFFDKGDGMPDAITEEDDASPSASREEVAELVTAFSKIGDRKLRLRILRMLQGIARYGSAG